MRNANFKQVKVGERFKTTYGTYVKIRSANVNGQMRNAVMIQATGRYYFMAGTYWTIGNEAVSILESDEI